MYFLVNHNSNAFFRLCPVMLATIWSVLKIHSTFRFHVCWLPSFNVLLSKVMNCLIRRALFNITILNILFFLKFTDKQLPFSSWRRVTLPQLCSSVWWGWLQQAGAVLDTDPSFPAPPTLEERPPQICPELPNTTYYKSDLFSQIFHIRRQDWWDFWVKLTESLLFRDIIKSTISNVGEPCESDSFNLCQYLVKSLD